jgi:exonuclease SbcC
MIPVELTLKGIYSYQKEQTIDFTRLTDGHLFAIFGAVGSGKSTILEAVTLALYNNTERLGEKGDNRYYNMMNLKSNELLIRFIFKAGTDSQEEYLAEVHGKRHRSDFNTVSQYSRRMFKKVKGEWAPLETPIEDVLGLSYENFRRTIIIPQGKFQEFLQLTKGKRTQMMKELFQLERFDLQFKTKSLQTKNDAKIQHLRGQLQEVEAVSEEKITEKETLLKKLRRDLKKQEKKLREKEKQEKVLHALGELFRKIEHLQAELKEFQAQEAEFCRREAALEEYQQCRVEFSGMLERRSEISQQIAEIESELAEKRVTKTGLESGIALEESVFKQLKADYQNRDQLRQKAEELRKVVQICELDRELEALEMRLEDEKRLEQEIVEKTEECREELQKIIKTLKTRRKEMPDRQELTAIKHWFDLEDFLLQNREALEKEGTELRQSREAVEDQKLELLNVSELSEWITPIERALPVESLLGVLEKAANELENEFQTLEKEIAHQRMQGGLETAAAVLREGQPCPVCGSVHHPQKLKSRNLARKIQKNEQRQAALREKLGIISETRQKLSGLPGIAKLREEAWENFVHKRERESKKLADHRKNFRWKDFSSENREGIKNALESLGITETDITEMEQERERLEQQVEKLRQQKEERQQVLAEAERTYTAQTSSRNMLREQLQLLDYEALAGREAVSLEMEAAEMTEEYHQIETIYHQSEEKIAGLRKELDTLNGQISALEKNLEKFFEQREALEAELEKKIAQSNYENVAAVEAILALEPDTATEKRAIEAFFRRLHSTGEQLKQFREEAKNQEYDQTAYRQLVEDIEALKSGIKQMNQEIGGLENETGKLRKNLKTKSDLQEQLAELQQRAENINTLMTLFRGSGFVNYISGVFLKNLCSAANERFQKLTRRQLRLEVTEDNNFQVRDFLHDGQVRSIKTLSGGQTFQAALSLALALADNIQKLSSSGQNFFFLDEGFGTLDRESLRIVFDTLKSLRKENRIVGIISHVEEMQQEIDVHLKIRNDEEKGSLISASWKT